MLMRCRGGGSRGCWLGELRGVRGLARSTVRAYASSVSAFCRYATDPAYGWAEQCQARFGTHPVQVAHEWNTAVHVQEGEADPRKRAFTLDELQALFDHADAQVGRVRGGGRKGWLPVFRDAVALKVAYGFGLRRTEAQMLDVADFAANPHAAEFGGFGVCQVRFGKALKGSPPKRRSVLAVWAWVPEALAQWVEEARPLMPSAGESAALWPSERGPRIGSGALHKRLAGYRDALGLDECLDFRSLRRSYVTHLIEGGWDPLFVQQQAGHEHASTTALYTCVSSGFRARTLRRALDATAAAVTRPGRRA
jgi:integrase/recombinase XerC